MKSAFPNTNFYIGNIIKENGVDENSVCHMHYTCKEVELMLFRMKDVLLSAAQ